MTDYLCPKCKKKIGSLITVDYVSLLRINGMTLRVLQGICDCGAPVHFLTNDRLLEDLVKKVIKHDKIEVGV